MTVETSYETSIEKSIENQGRIERITTLRSVTNIKLSNCTFSQTCGPPKAKVDAAVEVGRAKLEVAGFAPNMPPAAGVAPAVLPKSVGAAAEVWVPNKPPDVVVVAPKRGLFAAAVPNKPPVLAGAGAANSPPAAAPG